MIMKAGLRSGSIIVTSVIALFASQATSQTGFKIRPQAKVIDATWVEYWGATGDTTVDATEFFQACLNNARFHGGAVNLGYGQRYLINGTLRVPKKVQIHWNGNGSIIYSSVNDTILVFNNGSQTTIPSGSVDPGFKQPRHSFTNTRFARISGSTGLGLPIALINTTNIDFDHLDIYDYNSAFAFLNIDDGWCESNNIYDTRIAGCDTPIVQRSFSGGNASFATNYFHDVTLTGFTESDVIRPGGGQAVAIYNGPGTNAYRQTFSNTVIFLTDSTTGIYTDGIMSNITGNLHFEIIGSVNRIRSRAFHFGPLSTDLKFNLHFDFTGRRYLDDMFFNQSVYAFGPTGLTTIVNGANQNHGITTVTDSAKFTPLFAIGRADHLSNFIVTPGDTAYWFFCSVNDGQINIRGRRNKDIDMRAIADGRYGSATAFSFNSSTLPLLPIRAHLREAKRAHTNAGATTDSIRLDVRNTNYLLFGSGSTAIDSLVSFSGGLTGQTLRVQFLDDSTIVANLARPSGTGRLFLKDNHHVQSVAGLRMEFICEAEDTDPPGGEGTFWRETNRTSPDDFNNITDNDATPDASKYSILRISNSSPTSITDFLNDQGLTSGRFGKVLTLIFLNNNTTVVHNSSKIILGGATNFVASTNDVLVLQYDGSSSVWREVGRAGSSTAPVIGTVDSTNIVPGGVAASDLSDASVLNAKIAPSAVDSTKIKPAHVTSTDIKDGNVNTSDLADDAVLSPKIGLLTEFLYKPDMLEFLGGALKETAAAGASDSTHIYIPTKAFSVGDTATFDFATSKRFTFLDSIVVIAYTNTATSNVVFNCQVRQVQIGGAIAGAFNTATSKTIATGTAGTLRQWSFTSFGTLTASVDSDIIVKVYRTAGGTGGDAFVRRVRIYGVGLR